MAKRSSLAALVDDAAPGPHDPAPSTTSDGSGGKGGLTTKGVKGGKGGKTTKTTITLDQDDVAELDRIEGALRDRGIRVHERTMLLRLALRLALADQTPEELAQTAAQLAERWKRGG